MDHVYPAGPSAIPPDLTKPTATYKSRAWLAVAGLGTFVLLYFALAGWFTYTAYRLLKLAFDPFNLFAAVAGICAGFLAVFMWKALFFVQHRYEIDDLEVTEAEQPKLFAFLHRLADEAGAPRAHRVFLSPRVNAAVFYDLSILNLILPSKKNLEIGLGLVNMLTLGEMKAVLAHEFGHFAQRSMAVGRWVYIAQQIAAHIIAKRDALDGFLRTLSRLDLRIAWVGWIMQLTVWSIRSLMEIAFRGVVLAQRALSREMELQADLVAVSLTGSDALVHALHRLQIADEAWDRAIGFVSSEANQGRAVKDVFAVQERVTQNMRNILDQPSYGDALPLPTERPEEHRVFKAQLAQAPRMWSTHPANAEREANAKRTYIRAQIDRRSAWEVFADVPALKERMTAHILRSAKTEPALLEESLAKLDEQFSRAFLSSEYRGCYLGRSVTQHVERVVDLYDARATPADIEKAYPRSLAQDLDRLRDLEQEKHALEALRDGFLTAPGGIIRHRGRELNRRQLPEVIDDVQSELDDAREKVWAHDRLCRGAHLAAAKQLGQGWDAYLGGLLHALHYADHTESNLIDARGALANVWAVVTADGNVSNREIKRLLASCQDVYRALSELYADKAQVKLDRTLVRRMKIEDWSAALGDLKLPPPDRNNIGEWINAFGSWVQHAEGLLGHLRVSALEQLLLVETQVAKFTRDKMTPTPAPEATRVPTSYKTLLPGNERPRQKRLGLWDRFQTADGVFATVARFAIATAIVGTVVALGARM